jgi:AraC-like DNA-binding protein
MLAIETAIRLIVIGQDVLIAAIFLFGRGGRAARISGALLMLGIASYLYTSDVVLLSSIPVLEPVAVLITLIVPMLLWLFARAIFEAPWPRRVVMYACGLVVVGVWLVYLADDALESTWMTVSSVVMRTLSLLVVAHALWLTLTGRPDDLIERRRTFRLFFVVIVSLQVAAVLLVELVFVGAAMPRWLELANVIIIAALTIGLAIPMLRLNAEFSELKSRRESVAVAEKASTLGAAERVLRDKLLELMEGGYFRETGLTIRTLAEKLNYPEHQLRHLINGHLGYRNFSAFLNSHRINEAKQQLVDPEHARRPVLTIALDLGYGSLGPFNRAFKEETGMTPTDYRQRKMSPVRADSE